MALLPDKPESATVAAIYADLAKRNDAPRGYLGGSVIGRECERQLWYGFRWASPEKFEGRMLRLFDRGQREEAVFVAELRAIGVKVLDVDPSTGQQFRFTAVHGHAGGSMDAVALGIPEAPKTWHVCEFKTHNSKSFAALVKDGVQKAKHEHYAQMQIYMRWAQLTRALYLAVNKDNDELHVERIRYDPCFAEYLEAKAERVIFAQEPPQGISTDPAFYKCKFCPASKVCHTEKLPGASCRTCLHATPERDGDGRWSCAKWGADIPMDAQAKGCKEHRFIPVLLKRWGEVADASAEGNWVEYRAPDGYVFRNGAPGPSSFASSELAAATPATLRDGFVSQVRAEFGATIIQSEAA